MWTTEVILPNPADTAKARFLQRNTSYMTRYLQRADLLKASIQKFKRTGKPETDAISKISLKLISTCNLRCSMCFQWRETGLDHEDARGFHKNIKKSRINFDECQHLFDFLREHPCDIVLTGGEPMLHPEFARFVETLDALNCPMVICTNGTLLDKHYDVLRKAHNNLAFLISIDGPRATHDAIRGEGYFDITTQAIARLSQAKREGANWIIGVESTLLKDNTLYSEDIIESCTALGVDWMVFNHLWIANEHSRDEYQAFCRTLGLEVYSVDGYDSGHFDSNYVSMIQQTVERIRNYPSSIPVLTSPNFDNEQMDAYYSGRFEPQTPYYKMGVKLDIDVDGRVVMTKQFPEVSFGNITQNSIPSILGSSHYIHTAQSQLEKPLGILCACPDMHNLRISGAAQ